jgi:hypothetical protein
MNEQWPCNTPSENSSKSKTNTTTGKISKNPKFENVSTPTYISL